MIVRGEFSGEVTSKLRLEKMGWRHNGIRLVQLDKTAIIRFYR